MDIIERLRNWTSVQEHPIMLAHEAAEEIERLRKIEKAARAADALEQQQAFIRDIANWKPTTHPFKAGKKELRTVIEQMQKRATQLFTGDLTP